MNAHRLYLISPPAIDLPHFARALEEAFAGGDVGAFQLRLKNASDADIIAATRALMPIVRGHGAAFIMNDRADLCAELACDGVHVGQEDLFNASVSASLPTHEAPLKAGAPADALAAIRKTIGEEAIIGVSCHDSRHLAMEAGGAGADYVAFGAFYPTKSKPPEKLAKYGVPTPELLRIWSETTTLPCVAIGGMTPAGCVPLVRAGADFIAAITFVWEHPEGAGAAVRAFNEAMAG